MTPEYIQALMQNAKPVGGQQGRAQFINGQMVLPQQQAPQKSSGGIGGFLTSAIKDIVHPAGYFFDATIGNPVRELAAQATHNNVAYRNAEARTNKTLNLGNNGTDLGGALKTLAGNSAQMGLTLAAPEAKGIKAGAMVGGAYSGATGLRDNKSWGDIGTQTLTGALLGGAAGGVMSGASKLFSKGTVTAEGGMPSLTQRAGMKLENTGGKLMNSQTNLTRAQMRNIGADAPSLFSTMNRNYGLSNLEDIAAVAKNVTGADGIHANAVKSALMNTPGIQVTRNEMADQLQSLLDTKAPLVADSTRKNLLKQVTNGVQSMFSEQPLNPLANPGAVYDVSNAYKSQAADLLRGANVTSADKQLASVYTNLAKTLDGKLYSQPGVTEAIPLVKQDMVKQYSQLASTTPGVQGRAYAKLAQEASGINSVQQLRSLQRPWVLGSKIEQGTAQAAGNAATVLAGGGGVVKRAGNAVAGVMTVPVGKMTSSLGDALASTSGGKLSGVAGGRIGQALNSPLTSALAGNMVATEAGRMTNPKPAPQTLDSAIQGLDATGGMGQNTQTGSPMGSNQTNADQTATQPQQSRYPMDALLSDIKRDPKNSSTYMSIFKMVQDQETPPKATAATTAQTKAVYGAQNAMQALDNVEKQFTQAGGGQGGLMGRLANLGTKANINSNLTAYNSLKTDAALQIAVGLFGASSGRSPAIISQIRNSMPDAQDSPAVAKQKIAYLKQRLQSTYQDAVNYGDVNGDTPSTYDPTQSTGYTQQGALQ